MTEWETRLDDLMTKNLITAAHLGAFRNAVILMKTLTVIQASELLAGKDEAAAASVISFGKRAINQPLCFHFETRL